MTDNLRDKLTNNLMDHPDVTFSDGEFMADAILALLRESITLEWEAHDLEGTLWDTDLVTSYRVGRMFPSGWGAWKRSFVIGEGFESCDAAKAAALEHYRSTIMSALGEWRD